MKRLGPWIVLAAALLTMIFFLRWQGRVWTCTCGYVWLWSGNINTADNSQHFFDPYSFTHVLHGFMFIGIVYLLWPRLNKNWKVVIALSAEALWEVIENSTYIINRYRSETISIGYVGDTILNSFGDILACALGVVIARKLGVTKTLVLTAIIEVALLFFIRDSLLLNIIMLLYPIDAIRDWQSGIP